MISLRFVSLFAAFTSSFSFVPENSLSKGKRLESTIAMQLMNDGEKRSENSRRSFLSCALLVPSLLSMPQSSWAAQEAEYRQGIEVNAFNGLIFNYRGGDFAGLDASTLNEPSIPYKTFCERLLKGEVDFVEFMAPDGDAAYVTFKPKEGEGKVNPIRIGEGFPVEQHDGYSSPMFVVKTLKKYEIPYKFTVPGLAKFSS
ncbi:unnamed protein product [Cylindrotheca closterium]|uniref:Uncharacterized protein n=1 Tax=Cylindrotheca closterium TaxID=2856 RepID=A0AAD2FIE4_9STRA|nr:unnamed protein product [Cylindrotheca closterium]